jgi:cysteine desulfurase
MPTRGAERVYLDYNATAPLRDEARASMIDAMGATGNPSSIHAEGRAARALLEEARREIASFAGADPRGVVFTSGGTEAGNLALTSDIAGLESKAPLDRLILSAGEHPCMLAGRRFAPGTVDIAPLDADGRIDLGALESKLGKTPVMLALQGANNETGVVQPVAEAAALVHACGGVVVCDAVQLAGRAELGAATAGADFLILSAHKLGGPKGAGALVALRAGLSVGAPLVRGGGQERGLRAGTENVVGIAGFRAAVASARTGIANEASRLAALRDRLEALIFHSAPDATVFGARAPRLPNTTCFAVSGLAAATLLMRLDLDGIAASSGAACSSGKVAPSHVLSAMGIGPRWAGGAIRLSLGWASTEADVERFGEAFAAAIASLRRSRRTFAAG